GSSPWRGLGPLVAARRLRGGGALRVLARRRTPRLLESSREVYPMEVSEHDRQDVLRIEERVPRSLEERVARLEAKERILEMMMLYSHYCDVGDWDRVCALYTDDVERVLMGTLAERVQGRDKLYELYLNPLLPRREDGKPVTRAANMTVRHFVGTPVVRLAEDGR